MWCQQAIEDRWKFSLPIQVFNVVYLPVVFYFILNFKEYAYISNGIGIASAVVSWLSFVVFVGVTVLCTMRVVNFFKQYPKLSVNISKAADMILQENEYHLLHSQNMFLFDMKKIDLRNLLYPKINNVNILPFKCVYAFNLLSLLCPSVFYLRGLFIAIVLVAAQDSACSSALWLSSTYLLRFTSSRLGPTGSSIVDSAFETTLPSSMKSSLLALKLGC